MLKPKQSRLVVRNENLYSDRDVPYKIIKPFRGVENPNPDKSIDWNTDGRKYDNKGIATHYHQNKNMFEFSFRPPELKSEIETLVKKYITEKPRNLEQIA